MKYIISLGWIFVFASLMTAEAASPPRPNILIILSDDLGYADLGVHGCQDIPTPHIDRIAKRGIRCTDAYSNGSFCTPTRAALMSCQYQHRYGVEDLFSPLPTQANALPQRLKLAGYKTYMVGKWHLGINPGFTPNDRGFDEFFGFLGGGHQYIIQPNGKGEYNAPIMRNREPTNENRYLTDAFGEEAARFVEQQKGSDQPFFLYLAFNAVHTPLQTLDKYRDRFRHIDNQQRQTYASMLSAMDDSIGLVMAKLEKIGQLDNTLVIFTNDNGGPTTRNAVNGSSNAPFRGSKSETFEGGIRVPMLIQWPAILKPGTIYSDPMITFDISATALAVAGADTSSTDGVNLIPYLKGEQAGKPHETLFWRSRTMSNNYGVRHGNWKYVYSTEGDSSPGPKQKPHQDMLFDLEKDAGEQNNLAAKEPEKLAELKRLYQSWSEEVDADCRRHGLTPKQVRTRNKQ